LCYSEGLFQLKSSKISVVRDRVKRYVTCPPPGVNGYCSRKYSDENETKEEMLEREKEPGRAYLTRSVWVYPSLTFGYIVMCIQFYIVSVQ